MGRFATAKSVRASRGGAEAAKRRTRTLKNAWSPYVVWYCESLLARPMPDVTFEALVSVLEWRSRREIPDYAYEELDTFYREQIRRRVVA